jgi:UDP-N-acetylmuramoyl-L-alanyl-D-glutamate--2,6-diaminopimelate ligase
MEERFYAIRVAVGMANAGDVVVIAGKGHEDYVDWTIDQVRRAEARIASQ